MNVTKNENFYELAAKAGRDAWAVWNSESFKELRERRKDPAYLQPDDKFEWPPPTPPQPAPTGGKVTAFLRPQPKVLDVYLGFMDEEVNARLRAVVAEEVKKPDPKTRRPVLLIERGRVSPGDFVLEWPIDNYPKEAQSLTITQVSSAGDIQRMANLDGVSNSAESADAVLARILAVFMEQDVPKELSDAFKGVRAKRYFDLLSMLQKRRGDRTKVPLPGKSGGNPVWLTIVRFNVGDDRNAPIVVLRTPEMGLQPSLMAPYMAFLFKAISSLADQLASLQAERWHKLANPVGETLEQTRKRTLGWPVRVCQFGAQGSTSPEDAYKPGSVLAVIASLYVGPEIDTTLHVSGGGQYAGTSRDQGGDDPGKSGFAKGTAGAELSKWESEQGNYGVWACVSLCTPARIFNVMREKIPMDDRTLSERIAAAENKARLAMQSWGKEGAAMPKLSAMAVHEAKGHPLLEKEKEFTKDATDLKSLIKTLTDHSLEIFGQRAAVTMTSSFFGGQDDKAGADAVGIVSVGMEDYHVLRVLQTAGAHGAEKTSDYPLLLGWRIDRINCDPRAIPDTVEKAFNAYIKQQEITKSEYVDVIGWGLTGTLGPDTPGCAKWGFPATLEPAQAEKLFYKFVKTPQVDEYVPNPLFVEIATDLVKELKTEGAKAISGAKFTQEVEASIKAKAAEVFTEWRKASRDKAKGNVLIGELLDLLIGHASFGLEETPTLRITLVGTSSEALEVEVEGVEGVLRIDTGAREVKAKTCKLKIAGTGAYTSGPGVVELKKHNESFKVRVEYGGATKMKTWLRPGKWAKTITAPTVQDFSGAEHFDGAAVDRAFYKSCNLMALQSLAVKNLLGANE